MSSCPDCIFEIHQLWQSGFSRVYSNCCCSCSFKPEIIKIGQSSHKMYSNNIVNFQESITILNACTKKVWKPIECTMYSNNLHKDTQKLGLYYICKKIMINFFQAKCLLVFSWLIGFYGIPTLIGYLMPYLAYIYRHIYIYIYIIICKRNCL